MKLTLLPAKVLSNKQIIFRVSKLITPFLLMIKNNPYFTLTNYGPFKIAF